jgi:hypothetical protein
MAATKGMLVPEENQTEKLPVIAYVDEHEDARHDFLTDAFQSGLFSEIHVFAPEPTLPEMVAKLLDLSIDALISDYQLSEAAPVEYTGEALVEAFLERRAGFPCFIQTSYDDAALRAADDVNRVYSKNPKAEGGGRQQFVQRIIFQIERHRARLREWHDELTGLLALDRKSLNAGQVERIIELDDAIESNMGSDDALTQQSKRDLLKDENLVGRQADLITETEKLIEDMRRALDD